MTGLTGYMLLAPEAILLVAAFVALFMGGKDGTSRAAAWLAALASAAAALLSLFGPSQGLLFGGMLFYGGYTPVVRCAIAGLAAVWFLAVAGKGLPKRTAPGVALALFSAAGGLLLVSAADLVTFVLAVEISTMPAYVLMGYNVDSERSVEGALKYFLLSVLTSLVMLYGLSFVFGMSGSTSYIQIAQSKGLVGPLALVAALLTFTGLFAKLSAAPFHFWAPDAYEGAPAITTAFVSTVPKIAGLAALVRLYVVLVPSIGSAKLMIIAMVGAILSMLVGNLAAYPQQDLRRLMAYSGIAHSGYLLVGIAASTTAGLTAALFYAIAYTAPTLGIMLAVSEVGDRLDDFDGLVGRLPWLAWTVTVLLLSLIGVPPLAGFFGKLYLFGASVGAGQAWLAVVAVAFSVISAGYYFRIIRPMFWGESAVAVDAAAPGAVHAESDLAATDDAEAAPTVADLSPRRPSWPVVAAIVLCLTATVLIGLASGPVLGALLSR